MFKNNKDFKIEMPKEVLEIQNLDEFQKIHDELLDILFEKYYLSIPSAVGILEIVKNDIITNPNLFDDEDYES